MKIKDVKAKINEGWSEMRPINRDRYTERKGLEGPFQTKSGKVVYYDPREGSYYDPDTDMYLTYSEWKALDNDGSTQMHEGVDDYVEVDRHEFNTVARGTGAQLNGSTGGLYIDNKLVGYRDQGVFFLDPEYAMAMTEDDDRMPKAKHDEYYRNIWGQSHTAQKKAQAASNRSAMAGSSDYSVYTWNDLKSDRLKAVAKADVVDSAYEQAKATNSHQRKALNKLAGILYHLPRYLQNQAEDINGYGTIYDGKQDWDTVPEKQKAAIVRKQAQVKSKAKAINAQLEQLGFEPLQLACCALEEAGLKPNASARGYMDQMDQAHAQQRSNPTISTKGGVTTATGLQKPPARLMKALQDEERKRRAAGVQEDKLGSYRPGVTVLKREISFNDHADDMGQNFDGAADYETVKKIRWPYGIEVDFNDSTRSVRFKTAKMKTVAKILNKHIDFGEISAADVLDLPAALLYSSKNNNETMVEAMPPSDSKIVVSDSSNRKVAALRVQSGAKAHHIAQELYKIAKKINLNDMQKMQLAREIAAGKTATANGFTFTREASRPAQYGGTPPSNPKPME